MPEYQFEDVETGQEALAFFPMADAPEIGSVVEVNGRTLRRRFSDCQINADPVTKRYPIASRTLPRWLPGCEHTRKGPKGSLGRPIIRNKEHEKRICGEHGFFKGQ